jgi:hypothetical protein
MKLNLILYEGEPLNGYINISPVAKYDDVRFVRGDITQLDAFADDGEMDEVRSINILENFKYNEVDNLLNQWIRKLRRGGILTLGDTELVLVCKAIANRDIDLMKAQELLYGSSITKQCGLNSLQLAEILRQKNMKILTKRIEGYTFILQAERR